MKELILIALLNKYKNLGFGQKSFQGVAEFLSQTVTEETAIETAIGGVETLLKSFQSDADARVTSAVAKAKAEKDPKEPGADPKEPKTPEGDEPPAWAKALIESNKKLETELNTIKSGKTSETRLQQLEGKLVGVPASYKAQKLKDAKLFVTNMDETAFNEYLTGMDADITTLNQELADGGLSKMTPPDSVRKSVEETKAIADQINAGTQKIVEQSKK
jgi:hypothetical protein